MYQYVYPYTTFTDVFLYKFLIFFHILAKIQPNESNQNFQHVFVFRLSRSNIDPSQLWSLNKFRKGDYSWHRKSTDSEGVEKFQTIQTGKINYTKIRIFDAFNLWRDRNSTFGYISSCSVVKKQRHQATTRISCWNGFLGKN